MARVISLHEIALRPDAKAEDFERFFTEEVASQTILPGCNMYLLK